MSKQIRHPSWHGRQAHAGDATRQTLIRCGVFGRVESPGRAGSPCHGKRAAAFTLVELLVVVGVIAVLIGILLPALAHARRSAQEIKSVSGMRQMLIGYTMYHQENRGALLMGYAPALLGGSANTVVDPVSGQTFGSPVADRYPWRLLPYVSAIWPILHGHEPLPPLPGVDDSASAAFSKAYTLSLNPTYGINGAFVGGDLNFSGFVGGEPNTGKHVVFRATEVKRSAQLLVFADCRSKNVPGLAAQGLHFLTPPRANGLHWTVVDGQAKPVNTVQVMGVPQGWYTSRVVTGFFDGHVQGMLPDELQDMRLWANDVETSDYDYAP